jgi:hypothetical protein
MKLFESPYRSSEYHEPDYLPEPEELISCDYCYGYYFEMELNGAYRAPDIKVCDKCIPDANSNDLDEYSKQEVNAINEFYERLKIK